MNTYKSLKISKRPKSSLGDTDVFGSIITDTNCWTWRAYNIEDVFHSKEGAPQPIKTLHFDLANEVGKRLE